jgi:hypothetical protein
MPTESSHHVVERLAALAGRNGLFLPQEPVAHYLVELQAFIRVAEQLTQLGLQGAFDQLL